MTIREERLPVAGRSYAAYAVARGPDAIAALAIAHAEGSALVVDAVRQDVETAAATRLAARYGAKVTVAPADADDTFDRVHAICGVFSLLTRQRLH